jgi:hypothetical protein
MTEYNKQKRRESLEWLQARGKWVLDSKFVPTCSRNTNIKQTFDRVRNELAYKLPSAI